MRSTVQRARFRHRLWDRVFRRVCLSLYYEQPSPPTATWVCAWAVAGICYENHSSSQIEDETYDKICRELGGRDVPEWITEGDLRAGTAMSWKSYPPAYHRPITG